MRLLWELARDLPGQGRGYFQRYGDTFEADVFGTRVLMTRDPDVIWDVLVRKDECFIKDKATRGLSSLLGWGLVTADGPDYKTRRREVQPFFQPARLVRYTEVVREEIRSELPRLKREGTIDLRVAMTRVTLAVALRCFFEEEATELERFDRSMAVAMDYFSGIFGTLVPMPLAIPTPGNLRYRSARRFLRQSVLDIIARARLSQSKNSLLGQLIASHAASRMSDEQLRDEALTMLVAGHETSSLTLAYALGALAQRPDLQREIAEVGAGSKETPSPAQLLPSRLALLETLRLFPVTVALARECAQPTTVAGIPLAPRNEIVIHQWAAQRHEGRFARADEFDPERFRDTPLERLPKGAFLPFGAGPRVCIGQHFALLEMQVILEEMLAQVELIPRADFPPPLQVSITARPRAPLWVAVRPRA